MSKSPEKQPLLVTEASRSRKTVGALRGPPSGAHRSLIAKRDPRRIHSETDLYAGRKQAADDGDSVTLKRHMTLLDCIAVVVGNVIGSGIFIAPKGVFENIGSIGGALVIWAAMGVYSLIMAMCYAELGVVLPMAGGDYAYVFNILGPIPGFLCAWVHVLLSAPAANGVIAQTASIYLIKPLGLECQTAIVGFISIFLIATCAAINMYSSKIGAKVQVFFSGAKVLALCIIIIAGFVFISRGYTKNFSHPFQGTVTDFGLVAVSALDGYFAYKGWELVNTLPEEMINPKRDLPLGIILSVLLVTGIYVLTNVAYFTILSPAEFVSSSAVALTFTQKALGVPGSWLISIGVALSCIGTINGSFLADSRYIFAAGRYGQVPQVFSMIHIQYLTPVACIVVLAVVTGMYALIPSVDSLQQYASLAVQLKILTTLLTLIYYRWSQPNIHRPLKIPMVVILLIVTVIIILLGLSIYQTPATAGAGVGLFFLGIPIYLLGKACKKVQAVNTALDTMTVNAQQLCFLVPEDEREHFNLVAKQ